MFTPSGVVTVRFDLYHWGMGFNAAKQGRHAGTHQDQYRTSKQARLDARHEVSHQMEDAQMDSLDKTLDRLERTTRSLDGMLYRLRTGRSGGRNSASTEATMRMNFEKGREYLRAACAVATDEDDQPGTRFDKVAARWNRVERRYMGLEV